MLLQAKCRVPGALPGVGRQGGDVEAAVSAAYTGDAASCLVAVAGGIMYADKSRDAAIQWRDRIRRTADRISRSVT